MSHWFAGSPKMPLGMLASNPAKPDDIVPVMKKAFDTQGPVIVGVHVDYRDNHKLFEMVHEDSIH
jgi:thiamine pyrophosphate-dependent acetolactate synthase large subunit-like protein